ncbi:MAG: hypothetical protein A3E78_02005, partial [Alphaproteobacteria bacterium RIFCSPHIGHO2_12_FULL_63_12]
MRILAGVFAAAGVFAMAADASAARYTASKVSFQDVTGEVKITTTGGEDVDVSIRQGKVYHPVTVKLVDGELVIAGERWREEDLQDCCNNRIRRVENLQRDRVAAAGKTPEDKNAFFDEFPVIEISMPRKSDVSFVDARLKLAMGAIDGRLMLDACYVYGETGDLGQATIGVVAGSRLAIGNVKSMLELDVSGDAAVTGGSAAMADIDIAGAGDVMIGAVDGMLDVSIAGSGLARVARIDGPMTVRIAGSGAVAVQGGKADKLTATIDGSGGVIHEGTAV